MASPRRYDSQAGNAADRLAAIVPPSAQILQAANDNAAPLRRRLSRVLVPLAGAALAGLALWQVLS